MPKESTHLLLAGLAAAEAEKRAPYASEIIKSAPNLFRMGSVAPDSIFNYRGGAASELFSRNYSYAHGKDNPDLFGYLGRFAETGAGPKAAMSFGLGILCHLCADMVIHPLVFYFTGVNEGDRRDATVRHYRFEAALDRMNRWLYPKLKEKRLSDYFVNMETDLRSLALMLEALHSPPQDSGKAAPEEYISMYRSHCRHEGYYGRLFYRAASAAANAASLGKKKELPALFYVDRAGAPSEVRRQRFLNTEIEYRIPATGERRTTSLSALYGEAMDLFFGYAETIGGPAAGYAGSWIPRSPNTGQSLDEDGPMRYFDIRPFESLGI